MREFIISDYHFNHSKMVGDKTTIETRKQFKSVKEMNDTIIANHNAVVTDDDIVYIAGDLGMTVRPKELFDILSRMKGQLWLVQGSHDNMVKYLNYLEFNNYYLPNGRKKFVFKLMGFRFKRNALTYYVTHFPLGIGTTRDNMRNFHGHLHDAKSEEPNLFNVCVDSPELPEGMPFGAPLPLDVAMELLEHKWTSWLETQPPRPPKHAPQN